MGKTFKNLDSGKLRRLFSDFLQNASLRASKGLAFFGESSATKTEKQCSVSIYNDGERKLRIRSEHDPDGSNAQVLLNYTGSVWGGELVVASENGVANIDLVRSDQSVGSGNNVGMIKFGSCDDFDGYCAMIQGEAGGTWASGDTPGRLNFMTTPSGDDGPYERMRIDKDGNVLKYDQPAFAAYLAATKSALATGTNLTLEFDTEYFDIGADYNNSLDTFTAPVDGKYFLSVSVALAYLDTAATWYAVSIITTKRTVHRFQDFDELSDDPTYYTWDISGVFDMDAGDTAKVSFYQTGGSAQTVQLGTYGGSLSETGARNIFSGYLLG